MKRVLPAFILIIIAIDSAAQAAHDSITISRCTIEKDWYSANWTDSLTAGKFKNYITQEKTV
jgi:hypothetical protein